MRLAVAMVVCLVLAGCTGKPGTPDCTAVDALVLVPGLYGHLNATSHPGWSNGTALHGQNTDGSARTVPSLMTVQSNWSLLLFPDDWARLLWLDANSKTKAETIAFLEGILESMGLPSTVTGDGGVEQLPRQHTCHPHGYEAP